MENKTIKQIIEENPDKEIRLYDKLGIWGELPLTENNIKRVPDSIEIVGNMIKAYIG